MYSWRRCWKLRSSPSNKMLPWHANSFWKSVEQYPMRFVLSVYVSPWIVARDVGTSRLVARDSESNHGWWWRSRIVKFATGAALSRRLVTMVLYFLTNVSTDSGSLSASSSVRVQSSEFNNSFFNSFRLKFFQDRFDVVMYFGADDECRLTSGSDCDLIGSRLQPTCLSASDQLQWRPHRDGHHSRE